MPIVVDGVSHTNLLVELSKDPRFNTDSTFTQFWAKNVLHLLLAITEVVKKEFLDAPHFWKAVVLITFPIQNDVVNLCRNLNDRWLKIRNAVGHHQYRITSSNELVLWNRAEKWEKNEKNENEKTDKSTKLKVESIDWTYKGRVSILLLLLERIITMREMGLLL